MAGDYAGDISPESALDMLRSDPDAVLIDVRTRAEWSFVGIPDLSGVGKEPCLLEWQSYPGMELNPTFLVDLKQELARRGTPDDARLLFLCRSGARSRAAAAAVTVSGHSACFNIAGGFEGGPDPSRHRGVLDGWKALDLPWIQS